MPHSETSARFFFLFAVFAVLLTYPILSIADQPDLLWGAPRLLVYFFVVWALAVGAIFWVVWSGKKNKR